MPGKKHFRQNKEFAILIFSIILAEPSQLRAEESASASTNSLNESNLATIYMDGYQFSFPWEYMVTPPQGGDEQDTFLIEGIHPGFAEIEPGRRAVEAARPAMGDLVRVLAIRIQGDATPLETQWHYQVLFYGPLYDSGMVNGYYRISQSAEYDADYFGREIYQNVRLENTAEVADERVICEINTTRQNSFCRQYYLYGELFIETVFSVYLLPQSRQIRSEVEEFISTHQIYPSQD